MPKIDLSAFVTSMAKSVDDAVEEMRREKVKAGLEEFECTLTLLVDVDVEPMTKPPAKGNSPGLNGLKLLEVYKTTKPLKTPIVSVPEQPEKGTITIRAVFSPGET